MFDLNKMREEAFKSHVQNFACHNGQFVYLASIAM